MGVAHVKYHEAINDVRGPVKIVNNFLGKQLNEEEMVKVVEKSLYRQGRRGT